MKTQVNNCIALVFIAASLAACGAEKVVVQNPAPSSNGSAAAAAPANSAPQVVETVPVIPSPPSDIQPTGASPGSGYVWIKGHYSWTGSRYEWVSGTWAEMPQPESVWVPGHWRATTAGYVWIPGAWRSS